VYLLAAASRLAIGGMLPSRPGGFFLLVSQERTQSVTKPAALRLAQQ
jgi:hypothetical protein